MILYADSDAAYLISEGAKSRIAVYFYCSNKSTIKPPSPPINAPIHIECKLLCHVVTSAAKVETSATSNTH